MKILTQEYVRQHLDYDPEKGELRWKLRKLGRPKSLVVGGARPDGYIKLRINGRDYLAHRIIWLWHYGYFPENDLDHIDRNPSNNKLCNLREVSQSCNNRNCGMDKRNKSGVRGVFWDSNRGNWLASIRVTNRSKYLSFHTDFTEAVAHRLAAEQCLNWEGCDSNSSAYQYMNSILRNADATHKL